MFLNFLFDVLVLGTIYLLFSIGLSLSWGIMNTLNIAHAQVFMAGALASWLVAQHLGFPFLLLPAVAIATGVVLNVLLEFAVFAPIRRRTSDPHQAELSIVIASIGAGTALIVLAINITKGLVVSIPNNVFERKPFPIAGVSATNIDIIIVAVALVVGVGLMLFMKYSRHAPALRALAHDPYTCGLLGISASRLSAITMAVSGALAALAGLLLCLRIEAIDPHMGEPLIIMAFTAIILGGVGSVGGTILGSYLLAAIVSATVNYGQPSLAYAVPFLVALIILILRPGGIFAQGQWERP